MKLICVLLITTMMQVSAASRAQSVTLSKEKSSMKEVINEIQKQTGYNIIISSQLLKLASPVSVSFKNISLKEALDRCFSGQPFDYIINKKTIIISEKKVAESRKVLKAIQVTGRVTDEKGETLPGVSIRVENSQRTTVSDVNGNYKITVPDQNAVLVFTFIGFTTQKIVVGNKLTIDVRLKQQPTRLDDIVVIGYGEVKRKDVTGAVSSVNVQDLAKAPVRSFEEALAGRVSGVQVASNDGQPGSPISIVIRGQNSLTQSNSPLYVIDGFPIEDPENNAINTDDIESIDVLKDASAIAIYGARGANGVIIIKTKSGKEGPAVIRYNGYYGFQDIINEMKMMNPYEFVKYMLERESSSSQLYLSGGRTLEDYRNDEGINWQGELFRTAPMQNHTLSLSGGIKGTKYFLSASLLDQKGLIINSGYKRAQTRFTLNQTVNDKLKVGVNINYSALKKYGGSPIPNDGYQFTSGLMYSILGARPVTGGDDAGYLYEEIDDALDLSLDFRFNPKLTAENELRNNLSNVLFMNGYAEQSLLKNLKLRVSAGATINNITEEEFNNSRTRFGSPNTPQGKQRGINGSIVNGTINNYLNENTLTYNKYFNKKNQINAVTGFTIQSIEKTTKGSAAQHIPNEALGVSGLDEGVPVTIESTNTKATMASFLGRVNYTYNSRYLFTVSFRADGSSKFDVRNRWSYFPSGAVAWNLSEESFMKKISFVSDAKIRASYGVTGNNRIPDFAYLTAMGLPYNASYPFNNTLVKGAYPRNIGNRNLRWESTSQFDVGMDVGLLKKRINFELDYYNKTTTDLLLNASVPNSLGFVSAFKNIGKVENKGIEFTLNTSTIKNDKFSWNTNFNISFNRTKVLALSENQGTMLSNVNWDSGYRNLPLYVAKIGRPIAMFYGYIWEGNYQYSDFDQVGSSYRLRRDVSTNGTDREDIRPGDIKYKDINGDGIINTNDQTIIGDPNPDFTGGFSNNFSYKNFDLNVFMQFSYGNEVFNANRLLFEGAGRVQTNMFEEYTNRWTPENQNNTYFRTNGYGPVAYSTRVIEDGSFLRLKTVSLGYTINPKTLKKIGISSCRVYASAQNLVTWTKYKGFDPEVSAKNSALTPAFDYSVYPRAKTIITGLNLTL